MTMLPPWICPRDLYGMRILIQVNTNSCFGISARHCVITKDSKNGSYCCYVRCATLIVRVKVMPRPLNRCNSLPCTARTSQAIVVQIKGLVVCWMLLYLISTSGCYSIASHYKQMMAVGSLHDYFKSK